MTSILQPLSVGLMLLGLSFIVLELGLRKTFAGHRPPEGRTASGEDASSLRAEHPSNSRGGAEHTLTQSKSTPIGNAGLVMVILGAASLAVFKLVLHRDTLPSKDSAGNARDQPQMSTNAVLVHSPLADLNIGVMILLLINASILIGLGLWLRKKKPNNKIWLLALIAGILIMLEAIFQW
jgi:hypothetical protein